MVIQLSCIGRAQPSDLKTILPALAEAAEAIELDQSRLSAVLDWVQYRRNFRAAVMVRPFGRVPGQSLPGSDRPLAEIAIDVRRAKDMPYDQLVAEIIDRLSKGLGLIPDVHECIHLEDWVRPSKSVVWAFNRSYWRYLAAWDETFQKDYASALPGGVSDGTNPEFWQPEIESFLDTLDRLEEWSELPEEIHVLEFGVGDGQQAKVWLDAFAGACTARGRDYLERVRYLMADYSPHVLALARERVHEYGHLVSGLSWTSATRSMGCRICGARSCSPIRAICMTTCRPTSSCASAITRMSRWCGRASPLTRSMSCRPVTTSPRTSS
jgi:hypothetical protein